MVSSGPNSTDLLANSHLGPIASSPSWDPLILFPVQTRCYWSQFKPVAIGSTWVPAPTYSTCCWSHVEPVLKPLLVPLAKNCTKQRPVSSFLHTFIGFASDQGLEHIRACSMLLTMAPQQSWHPVPRLDDVLDFSASSLTRIDRVGCTSMPFACPQCFSVVARVKIIH